MTGIGNCLPTGLGSFPHTDPVQACRVVLDCFPEIPFWPQLPNAGERENMYAQVLSGLPGFVVDGGECYVDTTDGWEGPLRELYEQYVLREPALEPIAPECARGLYALASFAGLERAVAIKGQITGPLTIGLGVNDEQGSPIVRHHELMEGVVRVLAVKTRWQEQFLRRLNPQTIIFVDEPSMVTYGSGLYGYNRETVTRYIYEVIGAIEGVSGVHCCGNTDWSVLLRSPVKVISFDAYAHIDYFSLYRKEIASFLSRGGILAWGIVPTDPEDLAGEDVGTLVRRFERALDLVGLAGIDREELVARSLVSPSCGLGSRTVEVAEMVAGLTRAVSDRLREKYGLQ